MTKTVNIVHILVGVAIVALLKQYKNKTADFFIKWKYVFLITGLLILGYHAEHFYKTRHWIYAWHFGFVAPVIMLLGFYPVVTTQMLRFVAISMIGYHFAIVAKLM